MLVKNLICTSLMAMTFCSASVFALGKDLTITNDTDNDSTSVINGYCSADILGNDGVTKAHTSKQISATAIKFACGKNPTNCKGDVYMTKNCSGLRVATVTFDVNSGIKTIQMNSSDYKIEGTEFVLRLSRA